jgi:hypothetical protein
MSGTGRGSGSGGRRGGGRDKEDFGDIQAAVFGDDGEEYVEADYEEDDGDERRDVGGDENLGFGSEEVAGRGAARSVRQRGRGRSGRACGRRGASFAARSAARPTIKGKNFQTEKEIQLTRSVLAISQDPVTDNQQRSSAFWNRIFEHFKKHRSTTDRTTRSLDSKWGQIKHDVGEFIGCHKQVTKNKPT